MLGVVSLCECELQNHTDTVLKGCCSRNSNPDRSRRPSHHRKSTIESRNRSDSTSQAGFETVSCYQTCRRQCRKWRDGKTRSGATSEGSVEASSWVRLY